MLEIRQSETHTINDELYKLAGARPITTIIREHQLQFTGHCLCMPSEEPANIYVLYTLCLATVHRRRTSYFYRPDRIYTAHPCSDKKLKLKVLKKQVELEKVIYHASLARLMMMINHLLFCNLASRYY